ncbi:MAG TPA: VOC family protein, partial [Saprospiraceae bacterium]|nr:VOC family protein [Saprospiraceae bacterium]
MEHNYFINGIQQVGLGIRNVYQAWDWYRKYFHFDLPIFDEAAEAKLMLPHTEGQPRTRHAILALNYQGGGGLEIWQHTSFESRPSLQEVLPGDLGIWLLKIKVKDLRKTYDYFRNEGLNIQSTILNDVLNRSHFYIKDPYNNLVEIIESDNWHADKGLHSGGVYGVSIGVSDMDKALPLYRDLLRYDEVISDRSGQFDDFSAIASEPQTYRRVILTHASQRNGAFSKLLGKSEIELVQVNDRKPNKI